MRIEDPVFSMFGDLGGVKRNRDGSYTFDGAAGSAGISFQFPDNWNDFDRISFHVEAENFRPDDGAMALIVNDGYNAWAPAIAKNPYPWVSQGAGTLTYPTSVFASGAASLQLNETFGHSTNWKIAVKGIEFMVSDKKSMIVEAPAFSVYGDTSNTAPNENGSYTFDGDASALLSFNFPEGWDDFGNVTFVIENVENYVEGTTMSLIIKNRFMSWATINLNHGERYPTLEPGGNLLTYPAQAFSDGVSLQLNQYGHSMNWTMHVTKIVFHDGPVSGVDVA